MNEEKTTSRTRPPKKGTVPYIIWGVALCLSASAGAVTTQSFLLDSAEAFFEGELEGAAVHSDGSVRAGAVTERTELPDVPLAYSLAVRGSTAFIGTGTDGIVYRVDGKKVEPFAKTGELLVSSLAFGAGGALYAGTLPNGRIYRIETKTGKVERFSEPKGAKHVWALHFDAKRRKLIAATGPEGKVFAADSAGRATEIHKADASHVMALAGDSKGTVFAGTSDDALVLRLEPSGQVSVVHDFPGNEITAIDYRNGELAVTANQFKSAPGSQFKPSAGGASGGAPRPATRPRPGSGQVWRVDGSGRAEQLLARKDTHFTSVQWGGDGAIYVGGGSKGRVFRVENDASYSIWADVEERQVLGLDMRSKQPSFVTGDSAALYRVRPSKRRDAVWTSKALDAKFSSTWGRLDWRGRGRFVFQTRSGNTKEPGDTWSPWSKDIKAPARISSPPARFVQVRAKLPNDASAELRAVQVFYLPQNQRARVSNVRGSRPPLKRGEAIRKPPPPTTLLNLTWKVDNTDLDKLRYRIAYREERQPTWRTMFKEDTVVTEPKYTWDTGSIPDGYYVVRVEASDEKSNPQDLTLRATALSEPIRVDNHPPRIDKLVLRKGRLEAAVVDALGPIARAQLSVDGGPWHDVFPADGLLDGPREAFSLKLGPLTPGSHIVALRAFDAAGNQANREIVVKTSR